MRRKTVFRDGSSLRESTDKSQCDRLDAVRLQLVVDGTHALEAELKDVRRRDDVVVREPFRPQELQLGPQHAELLPTDVGDLAPQIDAVRLGAAELFLYVALFVRLLVLRRRVVVQNLLVDALRLRDPRHGQRRRAQPTELARARLDRRRRAVLEHVTVRAHVVERGAVAQQDVDLVAHRADVAAEEARVAADGVDDVLLAARELGEPEVGDAHVTRRLLVFVLDHLWETVTRLVRVI